MFERFESEARRVIVLAQEEARGLHHSEIDTPHLILGLLRLEGSAGYQALRACELGHPVARSWTETALPAVADKSWTHVPFTVHAKQALENTAREADALGSLLIRTEHLVLGIISVDDSLGTRMVEQLVEGGADRIRTAVLQMLDHNAGYAARGATAAPGTAEILYRLDLIEDRLTALEELLKRKLG